MSYSEKTQSEILADLLSNIGSQYDKTAGYLPYDMAAALSIELGSIAVEQGQILANAFGQTASGSYLDLHAGELGFTRDPATKATGTVTLTGENGTIVPAGFLVSTRGGVQYQTTTGVTITTGSIVTSIEAVEAGASGNVPAQAINTIPVSLQGVSLVSNADPTIGGADIQSDDSLKIKLLERARLPATSGNEAHYRIWAKEVLGVGDSKIMPLWNGPGTIKVVLIDANKQPASVEIVSAVTDYIEAKRPIGATVTYVSADALNITVSVTLTLESGYTVVGLQSQIEEAIASYLSSIAFVKDAVSYAQVGVSILSVQGILDYADLSVNGGTANVPIGSTEVAVNGTITLS